MATPRGHHYSVYVIELAPEVWDVFRFRRANPDHQLGVWAAEGVEAKSGPSEDSF